MEKLTLKVDTFKIFQEIIDADTGGEISFALKLIWKILGGVAKRAVEIDDKEIIKYMVRLRLLNVTEGDEGEFLRS